MENNSYMFLSFLFFGIWGFFSKLSVMHVDPKIAFLYQVGGVVLSSIPLIMFGFNAVKAPFVFQPIGIVYGLLTGIGYGLGCLFFFMAATKIKMSVLVTLTALYPIVTIILSFFILKEPFSWKQAIGIGFALIGIYFLSSG